MPEHGSHRSATAPFWLRKHFQDNQEATPDMGDSLGARGKPGEKLANIARSGLNHLIDPSLPFPSTALLRQPIKSADVPLLSRVALLFRVFGFVCWSLG